MLAVQVFGHVKSGFDIVKAMEGYGTQGGTPTANITVVVGPPSFQSGRVVEDSVSCIPSFSTTGKTDLKHIS